MSNNRTIKISGKKKGGANNKSRPIRQIHSNNNNSNNNNRSISRHKNKSIGSRAEYQKLIISPVPSSVDRNDLLNYIKQKAYRPNANFVKTEYKDQRLTIQVEKADDANAIVNLNNTRYRELQLSIIRDIRVTTQGGNKKEQILKERLTAAAISKVFEDHLKASYHNNPMKDAVDFSFINGSNPIVDFNSDKTDKLLFQIISKQCPKAVTVSFASNSITTLAPFKSMLRYSLDHVMNFNFSNNRISDLSELDYLSDLTLRELVFIGNPIALQPTYRMEVARRFPDLQILDSKPIGPEDFPPSPIPPLRANYCDAQERQQFAYKFLQKYLVAFDSERSSIINAYTPESRFSTTFVTDKGSNTRGTTKTYQRSSRNLKKTKNVQKNISLLFHGADQISNYFKLFPATSHHLTSSTIDTFLAPGSNSLIIIVHGHYLEKLFNTKRSYDRTFILAAAAPGSEAAKNGWEATILNEQLHIRSYLRFPRLEPQPNATPVAQAPTDINQEALVNQFSAATKLKPEFARECLSNNAWDYNQAYEVFQKVLTQGGIPATMYI